MWQDPYVEVIKFGMNHRTVGWLVHGDVEQVQDPQLRKSVFKIRGAIAASNYLRVPRYLQWPARRLVESDRTPVSSAVCCPTARRRKARRALDSRVDSSTSRFDSVLDVLDDCDEALTNATYTTDDRADAVHPGPPRHDPLGPRDGQEDDAADHAELALPDSPERWNGVARSLAV